MKRVYKPYQFLPIHSLKVKWLRHNGHKISKWERYFLKDIKRKTKLSVKQLEKIDEIYRLVRKGAERYIGQEHYVSECSVSDYAYIHDFDK